MKRIKSNVGRRHEREAFHKAISGDKSKKQTLIRGTIKVNSYGTGFVDDEVKGISYEIPNEFLHTATHNDTIDIIQTGGKSQRGNPMAEVKKIIEKAKTDYVGVIENKGFGLCLFADDKRLYSEIYIPQKDAGKAKQGDKALVKITEWSEDEKKPIGAVIEVIGRHGEHDAEMRAILLERGIATDFPTAVVNEAKHINQTERGIAPEELRRRKDFRNTLTFTIDPFDAKDFDDAISFKELGDGLYEVGVHIADVSYYVRPGSALDREARERGFSVYLVDRTIPMLPEVLSNDLCSLNPHEDKYAFSSVFTLDVKGHVKSRWFGQTVINSDRRFTYEEAQESIVKGGDYENELRTLNGIAKELRAEKERAGAIDFEQDEVKFVLDEVGKPIKVVRKKRFDAHKLVEEFMLLANREVALHMSKAASTAHAGFLYRIHDKPDEERIADLSILVRALGHELPLSPKGIKVKDLQMLMKRVEGKSEEALIKTAAVRSMAKAIYSTQNVGHFGLAFEYYTHFTSPIRRYADLIVHRMLAHEISKAPTANGVWTLNKKIAEETSEKEIRAAEAERASIKYKQIEYMKEQIGKEFTGTISGVTEWGIYIEDDETKSEGMSRLRDLPGNDFYALDAKNYRVIGQKTKKIFSLGDKVKFKVIGADMERRTLDVQIQAK